MLLKIDLRVQMDAKSGQLKNDLLSAPGYAQQSANGTAINVFEVHLTIQFRVHLIIHLQ